MRPCYVMNMVKMNMDTMVLGTFSAGETKQTLSVIVPPPRVTDLEPGSLQSSLERGRLDEVSVILAALGRGLGPVYAAQTNAERWRINFRPVRVLAEHWRKLRVTAEERYPSAKVWQPTWEDFTGADGEIYIVQTPHNTLTVLAAYDGRVDVEVAGMSFAVYRPDQLMTGNAWDAMTAGALLGAAPPENVLVLGLGGGTVTRQLRALLPDARIVGVEFDPEILHVAREKMGLSDQRVDVVFGDANVYMKETKETFDAVIDDLFISGAQMALGAHASVDELKSLLKPGGVLVVNAADLTQYGTALRALKESFKHVSVVTPPEGVNFILAASNEPLVDRWEHYVGLLKSTTDKGLFVALEVSPL